MTAQDEMLMLATKYQLEEGKYADYYQNHRAWCVTKKGAHKIAEEAGITMTVTDADIGPCYIAYRGSFHIEGNLVATEIGSCRFDGTKNTPERTHAPEMAWKRLHVRGVLASVAPGSGIYGVDEFSQEAHDAPRNEPTATQPPPTTAAPPQAQQQPQQAAQQQPATNPDGTIDWSRDPRVARCQTAQGWKDYALKLPSEWNVEMGKFCELTRLPRGDWERLLLDHCGKFQGDKGWWKPSDSEAYKTFPDIVFHVDNNGKSKCGWALQVKKKLAEVNSGLEVTGSAQLGVPNSLGALDFTDVVAYAALEDGQAPQDAPEGGQDFLGDVPF